MNKLMFIMIVMMMFSCSQVDRSAGDEQQRKQNEEAIKPMIQQLVDAAAKADSTKLFGVFAFSDEFRFVDLTGDVYSADAYRKMVAGLWKDVSSELISAGNDRFMHIDRDNVLWTHTGTVVANFKDGSVLKVDPFSMSMLFRNREGKWRIVFAQEAGQMPVTAPPVAPK